MDPIKQMPCTGPYTPHCGSSNALYWYPRPTSNLQNIQYHHPRSVPPRLVPPLPYSSSTQPPPLLCQPFPPPNPCLIIPATLCLLPLCPSTSTNSSTPKSNNALTTQPLSTPTTVYTSTVAPAALPILPLISNAIPQTPLQSFPIYFLVPPIPQMLPKLPGLVSKDGGINIMPFSDVYTDLFEKFKGKVARRELKKLARNKIIRKYLLEIVSLEESEELSSLSSSDSDENLEKSTEIGN
ncbi:proline-rich receptor-like protein kinase PERK2 isoform X2 [Aricia agestis]|nr:proline-rich receptor-like protein kinase PERK2 isoform X2 [Aricia agestis]